MSAGDATRWAEALRVAELLAADPYGCGGVRLRAGAGPVRDAWLAHLAAALGPGRPVRRCPPGIGDDRLLGGLDLAATLSAGRPVAQAGLLAEAEGGLVLVPMAERLPPGTAARLAACLDTGRVSTERDGFAADRPARFGLVLLDEGIDDEAPPPGLLDRLAFAIDLWDVGLAQTSRTLRDRAEPPPAAVRQHGAAEHENARPAPRSAEADDRVRSSARDGRDGLPPPSAGEGGARSGAGEGCAVSGEVALLCPPSSGPEEGIATVAAPADAVSAFCAAADALGIASVRGPLLALRVARLIASRDGRDGRDGFEPADAAEAARLVLGPRATRMPAAPPDGPTEAPAEDAASPEPSGPTDGGPEREAGAAESLDDLVLAASLAAIPPGLLASLAGGAPPRGGRAGRAGAAASASRQGRPIGARPGDPRHGRLAVLATLRAAAPWQGLRRAERGPPRGPGIVVRPEDVRITRYRQRTESTTIFTVDASGSAALERLAEAKGAVELLLAEAYVRRDRVALVAFRGRAAELVLPPTRSLVRAKRGLAGLPGGGGTPLAAGLDAAGEVARAVRRTGGTPVVVLLTDGRANVDRAGAPGRPQAAADALAAAGRFREAGLSALLIDTAARPQDAARALAAAMGARYLALPHADARTLGAAVRAAGEAA